MLVEYMSLIKRWLVSYLYTWNIYWILKAVMLAFRTSPRGLEDLANLCEGMHRAVEHTDLRWLHVDPHWIGKDLPGSRCLLNQSQVGLCLICQYQGSISMLKLWV